MNIFQRFADLLGIDERHAEDALHSERVAKHVISRRSFFGAAGALAGAAAFSFGESKPDRVFMLGDYAGKVEIGDRSIVSGRGSTLTRFDALLKERYAEPRVAFMNPRDHRALLAMLPKLDRKPLVRVETDKFCPPGYAFIALADAPGSFAGIDVSIVTPPTVKAHGS